jgi:cob(I)alamin adenosyltransferase
MRIYTKSGDTGETSLFGGQRVSKDSPRVEAYGAVDELNAALGLACAFVQDEQVGKILTSLQEDLLALGTDLATPQGKEGAKAATFVPRVTPEQVARLEKVIDAVESQLPPLSSFVLPGGVPAAAFLHLARTVCRRAERRAVALSRQETVNEQILIYLNRLSDLLFVLARLVNHQAGVEERLWGRGAVDKDDEIL